ncbi:hypothetical protein Syun_011470 [Stephania yunnanensis]|uniref:CULT domain-containing protein n=1 Tax=Stephania yunnanensis TaxID=152371 RepID=A0AAP0JYM6_9MAGN
MWKFLIGKQKLRLSRTGEEASIQSVKETNVFSFYIARMIAVDCDSVGCNPYSISIYLQLLLETNATSQRLRFLLRWLESYECLFCNKCESFVARRSNMLVRRQRATRALEYIHMDDACGIVPNSRPRMARSVSCEIYTFYKVHNVLAIGSPDKTIWIFPGYSSTPVVCKNCGERVGWYFATDTDSKEHLKSFWGIWIDKVHNQDLPTDKCYH